MGLISQLVIKAVVKSADRKQKVNNPEKYLTEAAEPARPVGAEEWACPVCGCVIRNIYDKCDECGLAKEAALKWYQSQEEKRKPKPREPRPDDWICPNCNISHDKGITQCWKCGISKKAALKK